MEVANSAGLDANFSWSPAAAAGGPGRPMPTLARAAAGAPRRRSWQFESLETAFLGFQFFKDSISKDSKCKDSIFEGRAFSFRYFNPDGWSAPSFLNVERCCRWLLLNAQPQIFKANGLPLQADHRALNR